MSDMKIRWKTGLTVLAAVGLAGLAFIRWNAQQNTAADTRFISGNGRIEATEIALSTRLAGRLQDVLVGEGDFVKAGQVVARLQVDSLLSQRDEARARVLQARQAVGAAEMQVAQAQSAYQAARALVVQRETDLGAARRRLPRFEQLANDGFYSDQLLEDERAKLSNLDAALTAARAQASAAQAAIAAARTQVPAAQASVLAAEAAVSRLDVELADGELKAPRDGRVQFVVAHPGEVVAGGARVLSLLDVSDVYMGFFLPETVVGRVALGSEVRIVLDAAPQFVIPAEVSFVAAQAQFTPKTVETASERQKLMFRVRAQVPRELLLRHQEQVKTGLPGVAWLRLDPSAPWPDKLAVKAAP